MLELDRIYNMDCLEGMKLIDAASVDCILTDIPFGEVNRVSNGLRNLDKGKADITTFELEPFLQACFRVCKGSIYIFCGTEQVSQIRQAMVKDRLSTRLCIWEKTNPSPMNGQHLWLSSIECCVYGKRSGAVFNEHCKSAVWRCATVRSKSHPTEKPVALFKRIIEASTNEGELVLDPCAGSGTACMAAIASGRRFLAFEQHEEYYHGAHARIEAARANLTAPA